MNQYLNFRVPLPGNAPATLDGLNSRKPNAMTTREEFANFDWSKLGPLTAHQPFEGFRKKVVFLDQFVVSNIARSLVVDGTSERKSEHHDFWLQLYDALYRMCRLQLLVCPDAPNLKAETIVHSTSADMDAVRGVLSDGTTFEYCWQIQHAQIWNAFRLRPGASPVLPRRQRIPIHGDLTHWTPSVRVGMRDERGDGAKEMETARKLGASLESVIERWRGEEGSFDVQYKAELNAASRAIVETYVNHSNRVTDAANRGDQASFYELQLDPPAGYILFTQLMEDASLKALPIEARRLAVRDFLFTEQALETPYNVATSLLFAALARAVRSGQKKIRPKGMWYDFQNIGAYLPHCDVMFIDNECAQMIAQRPVCDRLEGSDKIYSLRSRDALLEWVLNLERDATAAYLNSLRKHYRLSADSPKPYRQVIEKAREREAKRESE